MARLRDGVWLCFLLGAFMGTLGFPEALVFGGLAWFGFALLRRIPRSLVALRPHLAGRWRLVNRILLIYALIFTGLFELIRSGRLGGQEVTLLALIAISVTVGCTLAYWKRLPRRT